MFRRLIDMYAIFEVEKDKTKHIADIVSDDLISRQTTVVRDGEGLGMDDEITYVMIEGSEDAVEKAKEMFDEVEVKETDDPEAVYKSIKENEDAAAAGVGTIFG